MRLVARLMAALLVATLVLPALGVGSAFAAAADHLSVTVSPGSGTAGDAFDVTVQALDNTDTIDTTYTGEVTFTSNDPGAILPSDYAFTGGDAGEHTFTGVTLVTAGNRTITATDTVDGSITGTSTNVAITPDVADHIVLTGSTANLASGIGRTFTATIKDQFGNTRTSDSTVVSFDNTGGPGTVSGEGTDAASAGVATKFITGQLIGSVTITASAGALTTDSATFTVVVGAATQIDLTGSTGSLTAGATRVLTATIKDAAGNVRTGDSSTVVTFAKSSGAGTVTGLGTDTASAGVATKTVTGAGAGSIVIDATGASITSNTLTFTVVVGTATQIILSGSTGNLASGGTRILTATIADAGGNAITTDNTTVVSFDQTSGGGSVTGEGTDMASSGVATKTLTGNIAGSVTITASASGLPDSNTLTFSVVPGAATQIVLSGAATNLTSGATRVLTATLEDAAGNTLTGDNGTVVTFSKTGGAGTVTGLGTDTTTAGVASVTVTGALAGSIDIDATGASQTSNTLTFTVVAGAATQIVLSGTTTNLSSGATRVLTATIEDAAGNVRIGDNTTAVTFSKTGGPGTVSGLAADTASAGVAQVTVTGVLSGSIDIHATAAGPLTSNTLTFTVVPGAATQIVLSGTVTPLASGATRVLTATLKDAAGNTEIGDNSTVVTFAKTTGAGTVTGLGTNTASAGVASVTVTGELVGSITLDATTPDPLTSNTLTFTITVGAASQIVLSGATTNLTSGATRVLTATIEDAAGNTRTGDNTTVVTFAKTGGAGTVSGLGADTAGAGVAQVTVTGALVGSIDIHATAAGPLTSNTLTFTVVVGAPTQIVLSGLTTTLTSGATRLLTATIEDAAGNVQTGDNSTVVTFSKTAGAGTVTGLTTDLAAAGVAQVTVTGEFVGSITIHATAAGPLTSNTLTFTVVVGAADHMVLSGSTANLASGTTRAITATIVDAAGNTLTGDNATIVTFAKTAGAGTVTGTGTDTATTGVASVTVTGVLVGSITFTASASGLPDSNDLTFSIVPGTATQLILTGAATPLTSGVTRVLTATLEDAAGNVETGDSGTSVTFSKTTGAGTVTGLGADTAGAGVAQLTVTGEIVGSVTIHATAAGPLTSNTLTFTVVVGPATQIVLSGSAANLASGSARTLTATIEDAAGNVEAGDNTTNVTFSKTGGAGTVSGLGADIATGGIASVIVTGVLVGSIDTDATAPGPLTSNTVTFTVVVGPLDHIVLSPQTSTVDPGVNQAYTVEAFDAADNSRGDVTSATTLGIVGGTCNNTLHTCQALPMGPHTVTATYLGNIDNAIQTINNLAPDAVGDSGIFINEDAVAFPIDVLNNDSDANGDPLTITAKTDGSLGTVAIAPDNLSVTYTPNPDIDGTDSFTYTVSDGNGGFDTATVDLTIVAQNDAPTFTTLGDQTVLEDAGPQTVVGFANGSVGPPNESTQTLAYVIDSNSNSALFLTPPAISPSGDLTFTSTADANGAAMITVHAVDNGPSGGGDVNTSPTQTFQIIVTAVDDAPVAVDDGPQVAPSGPNAYLVKQGIALVVNTASGVLTNDTDIDTVHTVLTAVVDTLPTHGTLTLNTDGSFTYTPSGPVGVDHFTYHAMDATGGSNIATVSLYVYVNHFPTAISDSVTVVSGSGYVALNLLANDNAANPDVGEVLRIVSASHPGHGTVVITGGGTGLSYRPTSGFIGTDVFSYTISDGVLTSSASVVVHVPKDTYKPTATPPVQTIGTQTAGTSTVKVHLAWTGADRGYGVSKYEIWQSTDGHSYAKIKTTSATSTSAILTLNHTYRFRVRAIDKKGNIGSYAYGPTFKFVRYQESSAVYTSTWLASNSSLYSSGHARSTSTLGATATLTTTGRTFSWLGVRGTTRGTADIFVDGVLKAHLNLAYTSTQYRRVIYSITFTTSAAHAFRIVYTGLSTRRVDLDAIIVLR